MKDVQACILCLCGIGGKLDSIVVIVMAKNCNCN